MILTLPTRASYPPFLNKAIELANLMVHTGHRFEQYLHASAATQSRLNNVTVEFQEDRVSGGWNAYGWSDRSVDASTIFVNRVLRDHLERITTEEASCSDSHEYQCIVFMIAVALFHECAELTLHWQGVLDPPSKFLGGVGSCAERRLFFGLCRLKIQKNPSRRISRLKCSDGKWTPDMRIMNVVFHVLKSKIWEMKPEHLAKFFRSEATEDSEKKIVLVDVNPYVKVKGASMHLGCKRPRAPPMDPNTWILRPHRKTSKPTKEIKQR